MKISSKRYLKVNVYLILSIPNVLILVILVLKPIIVPIAQTSSFVYRKNKLKQKLINNYIKTINVLTVMSCD